MSYLKRIESGDGSVHEVAKDADKEIEELNALLDSCYSDICRPSGKISKSTAQVLYIRECNRILTKDKE